MSFDFGFERFPQMFEERFGRAATTVLMGAVGMALFLYSVHTILKAIQEISAAIQSWDWAHNAIIIAVISTTVGFLVDIVLLLAFMFAVYGYYFTPRLERFDAQIRKYHEETAAQLDKSHNEVAQILERMKQFSADYERRGTDFERLAAEYDDLNSKADRLEDEIAQLSPRPR